MNGKYFDRNPESWKGVESETLDFRLQHKTIIHKETDKTHSLADYPYALLYFLVCNEGLVCDRNSIMDHLYQEGVEEYNEEPHSNTIAPYIHFARKALTVIKSNCFITSIVNGGSILEGGKMNEKCLKIGDYRFYPRIRRIISSKRKVLKINQAQSETFEYLVNNPGKAFKNEILAKKISTPTKKKAPATICSQMSTFKKSLSEEFPDLRPTISTTSEGHIYTPLSTDSAPLPVSEQRFE